MTERDGRRRKTACIAVAAVVLLGSPHVASADDVPVEDPPESSTSAKSTGKPATRAPGRGNRAEADATPKLVRLALSKKAAEKLSEPRVRLLVALQVGDGVTVPAEATGPLDEEAVRIFIDLPEPTIAVVQVQAPDGRLETRNVDVAGLPWEVATRFVAAAAAQSVRAQLSPPRKPRPRPLTPEEVASKLAAKPWLEVSAGLEAVYSSDLGTALFGSRLRFAYHESVLSQAISLAALGSLDGGLWTEVDIAASHRFWIRPDLRIALGLGFALALTSGLRDEAADDLDLWIRPHALGALDLRMTEDAWLSLAVDPGVTVDPHTEEVGLWVGGMVRLGYEGW